MTPQEQAQAVMTAYHDAPIVGVFPHNVDSVPSKADGWYTVKTTSGVAAAIRAAVELVLPEEPGPTWSDPREEAYDYQRQSRVNARARFLVIAEAMEATNAR